MVTLPLVLVSAHFVGDFLLQSDWMAVNKSKQWDALALHVLVYAMALGVALIFIPEISGDERRWFVTVNACAHFMQDAITSRITSRLWFLPQVGQGMRPDWIQVKVKDTRHWFFVAIGADQLLHYATLFITASWLL